MISVEEGGSEVPGSPEGGQNLGRSHVWPILGLAGFGWVKAQNVKAPILAELAKNGLAKVSLAKLGFR